MAGWLSEKNTVTVGIERIFFPYWQLPCFDPLTSSQGQLNTSEELEWLQTSFVIVHWVDGEHFIKIKIGFQGDPLSTWLVHELKTRPFLRAIYWLAQVLSFRLCAPRCFSCGTVVSNQPSTRPAGVLPCLPPSGPAHDLSEHLAHPVLEKQVTLRE